MAGKLAHIIWKPLSFFVLWRGTKAAYSLDNIMNIVGTNIQN
jgi:hypothetical protein